MKHMVAWCIAVGMCVLGVSAATQPDALDGLAFWVRADTGVTTNASGNVTEWADQSGRANHAVAADATAPQFVAVESELNSHPTLRFNGTSQRMTVATRILTNGITGCTVIAMAKATKIEDSTIIGIRTATHAFSGGAKTGDFKWSEFGLQILGEKWVAHHGAHKKEGTRSVFEQANLKHPVLRGVEEIFGTTDVYAVKNLDLSRATVLLRGAVTESLNDRSYPVKGPKNDPMQARGSCRECNFGVHPCCGRAPDCR